jgi:hypothetical protein
VEPVAGKPFGWAHNMEARAIRDHLISKGRDPNSIEHCFDISKISMRLARDYLRRKPKIGARVRIAAKRESNEFSMEELERLIEHFAGANDPVAQSILEKARRLIARTPPAHR